MLHIREVPKNSNGLSISPALDLPLTVKKVKLSDKITGAFLAPFKELDLSKSQLVIIGIIGLILLSIASVYAFPKNVTKIKKEVKKWKQKS